MATTAILCDNIFDLINVLNDLHNLPVLPPSLYVRLEGNNVSRDRLVTIMSIFNRPRNKVYLIDVYALQGKAFTARDETGWSLTGLLESHVIPKVFFDIRNDSDALFNRFNIRVAAVQDIQLMELATRSGSKRCVKGLLHCINNDCPMSSEERKLWTVAQESAIQLFTMERSETYPMVVTRPLLEKLHRFYVEIVQYLAKLWTLYQGRLDLNKSIKVALATTDRIVLSQSTTYNGSGRHMSLAPMTW